jgi:ribosome-binding factor A
MKNRVVRVSELLQRELGAMITRDHAFPDVLVTVNDMEMSPDLRHAVVFIGIIGPEHRGPQVIDALNLQHGDFQTRLSRRVVLKHTPRLHFRLDRSVERGVRITGIMETIDRQLAESEAREAAESSAADGEGPRTAGE